MNNKKVKIIGAIIGVVLFVLLMGGLSYAWFTWRSSDIVIAGDTACFDIESTKGVNVSNTEMLLLDESDIISTPNITITDGMSIASFSANIDSTCNTQGYITISIDVDTLQEEYQIDGTNHHGLKYALVKYEADDYPTISVAALEDESFRMIAKGSITEEGEKTIFHDKLPDDGTPNNYMMIFYIDGNNASDVLEADGFEANIKVEANGLPEATPVDDFIYILGDEEPTVDSLSYYYEDKEEYIDVNISDNYSSISLESDEILLVRYEGDSSIVNIPETYTINNTTYNTVILSYVYLCMCDEDEEIDIDTEYGIFMSNEDISIVNIDDNVKSLALNDDMEQFEESIKYLYFESGITISMYNPSSITNMYATFYNCASLIEAPVIPDSVTNMDFTFEGCTGIIEAPIISSSVTDMDETFYNCTSLIEAPAIPSSVTNMNSTFKGCTSLTGTIKINSSNVASFGSSASWHPFYGTTKAITVQVPNGSTTYTSMNQNKPSNITLVGY